MKRNSAAVDRLLQPEQAAARRAIRMVAGHKVVTEKRAMEAVQLVIRAAARGSAKRAADRRNDAATRTLVGARIPRETAALYRAAADRLGLSMYQWVCDALQRQYRAQQLAEADPQWREKWMLGKNHNIWCHDGGDTQDGA